VGKTWSVRRFGQSCFDEYGEVNFERNPRFSKVFAPDLDPKRIIGELELLTGVPIEPGRTLLFLDEIQDCPQALAAMRYFQEEMPELHVIGAGSLLEFAIKDISFPVGRIQTLTLRPLCFIEYLQALGEDRLAGRLRLPPEELADPVHLALLDQVRNYCFVGGMPEAVKAYAKNRSFRSAFDVQAEIGVTLRADFGKYAPRNDKKCLNTVLTSLARAVGSQIKYARLGNGYANLTLRRAFETLEMAGLFVRVPSADPSGLPLSASASAKVFKALAVDTGLLVHLAGFDTAELPDSQNLHDRFRGSLAEQFAGQEFLAAGRRLHYWSRPARGSSAEVDFLLERNGAVHPVEIKSGPFGRLKSLKALLGAYPDIPSATVLSTGHFKESDNRTVSFLPLYWAYPVGSRQV